MLLLLDEADVFLEQRNTENLPRHSIVAVFLRRLEYFKGILILTTNRVANFDDAVLNRIHIKLNYPEMGPNSRRQVWANILRKDREDGLRLTAEEVEKLVKAPVNGRQVCGMNMVEVYLATDLETQIKNIVYTARVMAHRHKKPLRMKHLTTVIDATMAFESDFNKTSRSDSLFI